MRSANRADRSDPVTPADNPKSGNAFSTGTYPRRCNLDLDTNRILPWTAIASRIADLHTRPGPLRSARWAHRRRSSRLRVGTTVRYNGDDGQGDKFRDRFHRGSPISAFGCRHEAFVSSSRKIVSAGRWIAPNSGTAASDGKNRNARARWQALRPQQEPDDQLSVGVPSQSPKSLAQRRQIRSQAYSIVPNLHSQRKNLGTSSCPAALISKTPAA